MAISAVFKILILSMLSLLVINIINYYQAVIVLDASINLSNGGDQWDENGLRKSQPPRRESEIRGPFSDCTPADIRKRPGVAILTTTNTAFLDMTFNMLESIRRIRLCVNTTIIAEDRQVYEYLHLVFRSDPGVHVLLTNSGETGAAELSVKNRQGYFGLCNKRQAYILRLLEQGLEVLFTDTDTFWFGDPLPHFHGEFDLSMVDLDAYASRPPNRQPMVNFCAGFVYFRPTRATIQFVKAWIRQMAANGEAGRAVADQVVMNNMIRDGKPVTIKVNTLDSDLFPWGATFYASLAKNKNHSAVVMHAAAIHGHRAKVERFKEAGMWLVNDTSQGLIDKWMV